ncbi:hypothetical protein GGS23DRAFT_607995 [Durotheca rogersii]|uniref:uncharacterized protein n=1 Tax=Durotheca rogersii TaxID=419775 RepID=UPI00221FFC94|nr:uncharacterized protein GGS23DRAFT_607995 [Durotheca rogersii]KAI5856688.1 hypothetical protein GGS23DRAFT_607995 [Durotheca rogersii]
MQLTARLLSLGFLAAAVSAAPVVERQLDLFQLQISCPANQRVDGRFLALNNNTLGVFSADFEPVRVYAVEGAKEGVNELHTYPVGIVDHSLGLVGPPGFLTLVDLMNPSTVKPGDGNVAQWDTFVISDGKVTNDAVGQWLAFPGHDDTWKVKWSDGTAVVTADFMPIEILYKSAGEGRYNGV